MGRRRLLRRIRPLLLAGVALLAAGLGIAARETRVFNRLELATVDARFSVRGAERPPSDLVVVGIDDVTFQELGLRWPFPRAVHAEAIDRLRRAGARVIAYDVQFTEPEPGRQRPCPLLGVYATRGDCALVTAVRRAGNVVLSTTEVGAHGSTAVLGGDAVLRALHARAGDTIVPDDADGKNRRFPYSVSGLTGFAVAAAERLDGRRVGRGGFDSGGNAWIDFRGPPRTIPEVPLSRVVNGRFDPAAFRGKVVVVGAVAPSLHDVYHTSVGGDQLMSGPELQASAIDSVRRGLPLRSASAATDILLIVLLALVAPLASVRFSLLRVLLGALVAGAAFLVAAQLEFDSGLIVAVVYALLAFALSVVGTLVVHYVTETRERRRTRAVFERFVPREVIDDVLARADDDMRIAVEREGTVMFSDLRGFTTFAESLPVERVMDVLNRYLSEMSEAILSHGGTLVSYMGDGIMAVFGAPIEQPDHADRALEAAREMVGPRLERFNAYLRDQGLAGEFRMGVGLNSGPVMSGNVGSEQRLEYTAIGDTTNTASRIEAMTKDGGHQLLVAEATRDALRGADGRLEFVGEFDVRGRAAKIRLWTPGSA